MYDRHVHVYVPQTAKIVIYGDNYRFSLFCIDQ